MFNRETWQGAQAEAQQPPVVEEPQAAPQQDATGDAPVSPTEVHDEPGISQQQGNVEDAAPQAAPQEEEQGLTDEVSGIELGEPDFTSNGGDAGWDSQLGEEWLEEISPTVSEEKDLWDFPFSDMPEEPTPGGYDGSGIAGGLGIDYDDTDFGDESEERSPDVTSEQEEASEAQSNFTDAEYQEVLDDLDHGNIEDVREFLQGLAGGNDAKVEAQDAHDDAGNNPEMSGEDYTYDEKAYEDAEGAMKDLQHALKHGDEEERAEALEKLQGYLGGFDKGANEDQDGTETQDEQIPSVSEENSDGDGMEALFDLSDADGNGISDWEELDSDGDGIKDAKEDSDGDGMLDWKDSDSDGNGIDDGFDDWLVSDFDGNGIEYGKEDSDGDGIENAKEDSDGDGMLDWKDSDSDGNGINDFEEIAGNDDFIIECF